MSNITAGFAMCGSFCTLGKAVEQMRLLRENGVEVVPIMSENARFTSTRFGEADKIAEDIEGICGKKIISDIVSAEPIGPQKMLDILIIAPCTGNTAAKLARGITDTCVTLAAKAHLRNNRPVLIAVSTNDALAAAAVNIGELLNNKNIFFVPMRQDDSQNKPRSVVADFGKIYPAMLEAVEGRQLQPIFETPE